MASVHGEGLWEFIPWNKKAGKKHHGTTYRQVSSLPSHQLWLMQVLQPQEYQLVGSKVCPVLHAPPAHLVPGV